MPSTHLFVYWTNIDMYISISRWKLYDDDNFDVISIMMPVMTIRYFSFDDSLRGVPGAYSDQILEEPQCNVAHIQFVSLQDKIIWSWFVCPLTFTFQYSTSVWVHSILRWGRVDTSQIPHLTCFQEQVGWGTWLGGKGWKIKGNYRQFSTNTI